jgi:uncharacterized RDD family membrane protein YckC
MECRYCGSWLPEYEHRCLRCGRRREGEESTRHRSHAMWEVRETGRSQGTTHPRSTGALAYAPEPEVRRAPPVEQPVPQPLTRTSSEEDGPYQNPLFALRQLAKVISFEELKGARPGSRGTKTEPAAPMAGRGPRNPLSTETVKRTVRGKQAGTFQRAFDFYAPGQTAAEAYGVGEQMRIDCDAPVASIPHRMVAGFLDLSMVLIALTLCGVVVVLVGGSLEFTRTQQTAFALGAVAMLLFYHLLWAIAGTESPGMRWAQLKLVNFSGTTPEPRQYVHRALGMMFSILPGALGLFWALLDEETLTWHDRMSRTFPTVDRREPGSFHRKPIRQRD